jgi:N-dimethylarginine dimethylaminohydrolase
MDQSVSQKTAADPAVGWGADSEYGVLTDVTLCRPDNFRWLPTSSVSKATLASGATFDRELASRQWEEMADAYRSAGVDVHLLPLDEHLPYQVFARDSSVMTPMGAIVTQMAQWWRRGEYAPVLRHYEQLGVPIYGMVTAGSFEGGDFNVIEPGCVLIGHCGERTQREAAEQVASWVTRDGWEARLEPIAEHYVHIDLMVCMVGEKLAAVCLETISDGLLEWLRSKRIELLPVSFRDTMALGCNVVALGNDRVLSTAASEELNKKLRALGFTVYDPDMTMFTRGGGGVHCMAQTLHRAPGRLGEAQGKPTPGRLGTHPGAP